MHQGPSLPLASSHWSALVVVKSSRRWVLVRPPASHEVLCAAALQVGARRDSPGLEVLEAPSRPYASDTG